MVSHAVMLDCYQALRPDFLPYMFGAVLVVGGVSGAVLAIVRETWFR